MTNVDPENTDASEVIRPAWANSDPLLQEYYDQEWGFPVYTESGLFERLSLEGFQAGLSWLLVLRRRPILRRVFKGFDADQVATMTDVDVEQMLNTAGMIRNERKIRAVINNAQAIMDLRAHSGLAKLIWNFTPPADSGVKQGSHSINQSNESAALAAELKRHGFKYVGPVSMYALMEAIGMIDHRLKSG